MGIFDWLFSTNKDRLTDDGLNEIYYKRQNNKGFLKLKFYKKNGLLDGEFIQYQREKILIKGQFKSNLMHGEWSLWACNNDIKEPGCIEIWENGHIKSKEILYENFLRFPFQKMKGKFTGKNINDEKIIKKFGTHIKKSHIAGELSFYGHEIKTITKSNEIKPFNKKN